MRTSHARAGSFGTVSGGERRQADLFYADLVRDRRPQSRRVRPGADEAWPPPPVEHDPARDPVLRPGLVGPAVDGTRNVAHISIVSPSSAFAFNRGAFQPPFAVARQRVSFDFAPHEPSPSFRDESGHDFQGTDAQRSAALHFGLFDPSTTAVVATAGGYGAIRILDELRAEVALRQAQAAPRLWPLRARPERVFPPKRIVGFSDLTAVLLSAYSLLGWASIHGPMLCCTDGPSTNRLFRALTLAPGALDGGNGVGGNLTLVGNAPANAVRGVLLGGNLTLVDALYGTPFFPSIQGGILFVEEVNEEGRKIDRMIEALKQRGAAQQARAVVVGQIAGPGTISDRAVATLFQRSWNVPVAFGLAAGHGAPNLALWIGLQYELQFPGRGVANLVLQP